MNRSVPKLILLIQNRVLCQEQRHTIIVSSPARPMKRNVRSRVQFVYGGSRRQKVLQKSDVAPFTGFVDGIIDPRSVFPDIVCRDKTSLVSNRAQPPVVGILAQDPVKPGVSTRPNEVGGEHASRVDEVSDEPHVMTSPALNDSIRSSPVALASKSNSAMTDMMLGRRTGLRGGAGLALIVRKTRRTDYRNRMHNPRACSARVGIVRLCLTSSRAAGFLAAPWPMYLSPSGASTPPKMSAISLESAEATPTSTAAVGPNPWASLDGLNNLKQDGSTSFPATPVANTGSAASLASVPEEVAVPDNVPVVLPPPGFAKAPAYVGALADVKSAQSPVPSDKSADSVTRSPSLKAPASRPRSTSRSSMNAPAYNPPPPSEPEDAFPISRPFLNAFGTILHLIGRSRSPAEQAQLVEQSVNATMKVWTQWRQFKSFVNQGRIVETSIAVLVGDSFKDVVRSFVNDILLPPIQWFIGAIDSRFELVHVLNIQLLLLQVFEECFIISFCGMAGHPTNNIPR